ncbi:MAG: TRAP transporter substrate-binding protein DctP [Castellaniella sp.]
MRWFKKAVIAAALTLPFVAQAQADTVEYPKLKLRLAHILTANFPGSQVDQWYIDEIKRRSDGKITIQPFWAGSMGRPQEFIDLAKSGSIELFAVVPAYYANEMPLSSIVLGVPFVYDSNAEAGRITTHLFQTNDNLKGELARNGLDLVFWHSLPGYRPLCTKKLESLDDFKGKRMRGFGEYYPRMWNALGATSVNVMPAEVYESLMRDTMDCAFWAYDSFHAGKLYEVAKYTTDIDFGSQANYAIMASSKHWEKWPESVRNLLLEVGEEAKERDIALVQEKVTEAREDLLNNRGVQEVRIVDADRLHEVLPDMKAQWVQDMTQKGLGKEAQEIIDTINEEKAKGQ